MKRIKRPTALSLISLGLGLVAAVLFVMSGSLLPLIMAVICFIVSAVGRKRESYDDYRNRYEERFGMSDVESDDASAEKE